MVETPELDKMTAVQPFSQKIGEFMEWLSTEKKLGLGSWDKRGYDLYQPERASIENLLAEFFDIDLNKVEKEKRAIIEDIGRQYNKP
jgi:hypothetical protein